MSEDTQEDTTLPVDAVVTQVGDIYDKATDDSDIAKVFRDAKEALNPKVEEPTEDETLAMEKGWTKDKEAFEKKTGKLWIPAKEFNERGSFFEKIDNQKKEINELKAAMKKQAEYNKLAEERAFTKAMEILNAEKLAAVQSGNLNKYNEVEQRIQEKHEELKNQQLDAPPQEAIEFAEKNKDCFNKDPENEGLVAEAVKSENYWLNKKPELSMKERMELVEGDVKRAYPDRFANKSRRDEAPAVSLKTEKTAPKRSTLTARMNNQQKELAKQFVEAGFFKSAEEYASALEKQGTLRHE